MDSLVSAFCISAALLAATLPSYADNAPVVPKPAASGSAAGSMLAAGAIRTAASAPAKAGPQRTESATPDPAAAQAAQTPAVQSFADDLPAAGNAAPANPSVPLPTAKAQSGRYLNLVLRESATYRKTMLGLVRGKKNVPFWVRGIVSNPIYVAGASQQVEIGEKSFELFSACSPKVCADSNLRVLFAPEGQAAWLRITDPATGEIFFGEPSPDQRMLLQKSGL